MYSTLTHERVAPSLFQMHQVFPVESLGFLCIILLGQSLLRIATVVSGTVKVNSTCAKIQSHPRDKAKDSLIHSICSQFRRLKLVKVMAVAHFQAPQEASGRPSFQHLRCHVSRHRIPLELNPKGLLTHMITTDQRECTQVFPRCHTLCPLQDQM